MKDSNTGITGANGLDGANRAEKLDISTISINRIDRADRVKDLDTSIANTNKTDRANGMHRPEKRHKYNSRLWIR